MSKVSLVFLFLIACSSIRVVSGSDTSDPMLNASCGAHAAYYYLTATGRTADPHRLLAMAQFSNASQSIEEITDGLQKCGVEVVPYKTSASTLSNLNGFAILYLTKNKNEMGHYALCHFDNHQVRIFEQNAPNKSFDPAEWEKAGLTTVVFLEQPRDRWMALATVAVAAILSFCLLFKVVPYFLRRSQMAYSLIGISIFCYGCTDRKEFVSIDSDIKPKTPESPIKSLSSESEGFINADKVVEQVGDVVVTYTDAGQAKAEVTFRNVSGMTLERSNFEPNAACCSPALLSGVEPEQISDQGLFKANFDIRAILPGENKLPITLIIKTDQFMSQWGNDATVVGNTTKARLAGPVILTAQKSVQGDATSDVSGELIITLPTVATFDANLIQLDDLARLESLKINVTDIVTRKDPYYTAYVIPYSGILSLDETMTGVDVLLGKLSYGNTQCDVRLIVNHFPEWTLSGGGTQANCVIINDRVYPKTITLENMRNKDFSIQSVDLFGSSILKFFVLEHTVEFAVQDVNELAGEPYESTLLIDVQREGEDKTDRIKIPIKISRHLAQSAK